MQEQEINGVRVVFRDGIPAKFGWHLIGPMNRLTAAMNAEIERLQEGDADKDVFIPGSTCVRLINESLTWEDVVMLVRAGVQEWDFDGDLTADACCDDLDTLGELQLILIRARAIFYGVNLSGE